MRASDLEKFHTTIISMIEKGDSKTDMAQRLGCSFYVLTNYLTLRGISHKGKTGGYKMPGSKMDFEAYAAKGMGAKTTYLKEKMFEEGLKERVCEVCKRTHHNNQQIPLEVHHLDGDRSNNTVANLQIICPNCHSQTPNFRGRKSDSGLKKPRWGKDRNAL